MGNTMMSSHSSFGTNGQGSTGNPHSFRYYSVALHSAARGDGNMAPRLPGPPSGAVSSIRDQTVTEATMRRLKMEMEHARAELCELEKAFVQELMTPSVREWLLPLMAIGLALSLYGSFSSANTAELGATGLVLLWSLSAFWFIHTRDRRMEMTRQANQAEMEIWSSRIEELQKSLEQTSPAADPADKMDEGVAAHS